MKQSKLFFGWYVAGVGTISLLFAYGVRAAFAIFFPYILEDLQMSRTLISGVVSLSLLVNFLLTPVAGFAVDKYGPKWLIVGGAFFCGTSLICMPLVSKLWHLYVIYGVTFAVGVNFMGMTVSNSMCVNWFIKKRATAIAITTAGSALGAAIFNPVSQKLIAAHGWKMAFAIIGVMMLAVVIPMALIFAKKRPEDVGLATDGDDPEEARKIAAMMAAAMQKEIQFTMAEVSKTPNFWFMALGWLIMASCGGFLLHIVAYCMEKGISAAEAAWALGYMALVGVASRFFWAPVNDRLNNRKVSVVSGLFIYSIGWIALLMIKKPAHLYIAATILGFGGAGVALMPALVGDQFGRLSMGKIYGFINLFGAIGGAIGPVVAGLVYDTTKSYNAAWIAGIIGSIIAAICFFMVGKSPYEVKKRSQDMQTP
ncbi:MAG: MFS transporter [Proteobacteria bacterium]|nr:MFS transporter [Pseudomonadota bacterium]MBU4469771.1 MFS transporter [Pseudomonadota bacterium]MCG2753006.1 MFS transporter [Desulfobacteraceae bacterium]